MTLTLTLPAELQAQLSQEATERGLPLEAYALQLLSTRTLLDHPPGTGAELVAYWQSADVIGSRPDITDAESFARDLRRQSQSRRPD